MTSTIFVANVGHSNKKVTKAIKETLETIIKLLCIYKVS